MNFLRYSYTLFGLPRSCWCNRSCNSHSPAAIKSAHFSSTSPPRSLIYVLRWRKFLAPLSFESDTFFTSTTSAFLRHFSNYLTVSLHISKKGEWYFDLQFGHKYQICVSLEIVIRRYSKESIWNPTRSINHLISTSSSRIYGDPPYLFRCSPFLLKNYSFILTIN